MYDDLAQEATVLTVSGDTTHEYLVGTRLLHAPGTRAAVIGPLRREWWRFGVRTKLQHLWPGTGAPMMQYTYDTQGNLHSHDDEPAVDDFAGNRSWYEHGVVHRAEDRGPALVSQGGLTRVWVTHGRNHRSPTAGPAYVQTCLDGTQYVEYWVAGRKSDPSPDQRAVVRPDGRVESWSSGKYQGTFADSGTLVLWGTQAPGRW